jgi:hypothetical protein
MKPTKDRHIKKSFTSFFSKKASQGKAFRNLEKKLCDHDTDCLVKKTLDKAHCSKDYAETCQAHKFYRRYGKDYEQMFIGNKKIKKFHDKLFEEDMKDY